MTTLEKVDRAVETAQVFLCSLFYSMMLVFGTMQVGSRYIFNNSTVWSEEAIRFCCIWMILVGSSLTIRTDGHVSVDVLVGLIKNNKIRAWLVVITRLVCVVFLCIFFVPSIQLVMKSTSSMAASFNMSYVWVYMAVPVGIVFMLWSYFITIPQLKKMYMKGEK